MNKFKVNDILINVTIMLIVFHSEKAFSGDTPPTAPLNLKDTLVGLAKTGVVPPLADTPEGVSKCNNEPILSALAEDPSCNSQAEANGKKGAKWFTCNCCNSLKLVFLALTDEAMLGRLRGLAKMAAMGARRLIKQMNTQLIETKATCPMETPEANAKSFAAFKDSLQPVPLSSGPTRGFSELSNLCAQFGSPLGDCKNESAEMKASLQAYCLAFVWKLVNQPPPAAGLPK